MASRQHRRLRHGPPSRPDPRTEVLPELRGAVVLAGRRPRLEEVTGLDTAAIDAALTGQGVRVNVFLPCEHGQRGSLEWMAGGQRPPSSRGPAVIGGATRVGNSSEQVRGVSPESHH